MPWHHIIPKHEWKLRFGNLKGVNAPDNLSNLYDHQHIQVHQRYYEEPCNPMGVVLIGDKVAWQTMAGFITPEEGRLELCREIGRRIPSPITRKRMSDSHIGIPRDPETCMKISLSHTGVSKGPHSIETKIKISKWAKSNPLSSKERTRISKLGGKARAKQRRERSLVS